VSIRYLPLPSLTFLNASSSGLPLVKRGEPPRADARAPRSAKQLGEHRLASSVQGAASRRFGKSPGHGQRHCVGGNTGAAVEAAGLAVPGERLTLHSLRHGFASLLIANGLNVVYVSRQLGHANANVTLEVYAHLFQQADHADTARAALDTSYATITDATGT
jgi:integrase